MKRLFMALAMLIACAAQGQNFVTFSSTKIQDANGNLLASGTAYARATDQAGNPISYQAGGFGQVISAPVKATVTAGVFTMSIANSALTSPANVCYNFYVKDSSTGQYVLGSTSYDPSRPSGYQCLQPTANSTDTPNPWCVSGTCNFDKYKPNLAPLALVQTGPTPTVAVDSPAVLTPATNPTVSNVGTTTGAVLHFGLPRARAFTGVTSNVITPAASPSMSLAADGNGDYQITANLPRARTWTVGSTSTLSPGSLASVSCSADANGDISCAFGVPQGVAGVAGGNGLVNTVTDASVPAGNSSGSGASANAALATAVATYSGQTLMVPTGAFHHITADMSVTTPLSIPCGGGFYVDSGKTLTLATAPSTPWTCPVFYGPGNVIVTQEGNRVSALWFGGRASIVEQTDAAISAACDGTKQGNVYVPGGKYVTSNPSTWTSTLTGAAKCAVPTVSHCRVFGDGHDKTQFTSVRGSTDSDGVGMCNSDTSSGNHDIAWEGIGWNMTDNGTAYGPWGTPFLCKRCYDVTLHDFQGQGNTNNVGFRFIDSYAYDIGPGWVYVSSGPIGGKGDSGINSSNLFSGSLATPDVPFDSEWAHVHDIWIWQINDPATQVSYVVASKSNTKYDNIHVNGVDRLVSGNINGGTAFEFGIDNLGMMPHDVQIFNSEIRGTSGTILSGYKFDVEHVDFTKGAILSFGNNDSSQATAQGGHILKHLHFTGGGYITSNDGGFGTDNVTIDDVLIENDKSTVASVGIIGKGVGHVIRNVRSKGAAAGCVNVKGAKLIENNVCEDWDQSGATEPGFTLGAPTSGTYKTVALSGNRTLDNEVTQATGTLCTIAAYGTATVCPGSTVTSPYFLLSGSTFPLNLSNEYITVGAVQYAVAKWINATHGVLESPVAWAASTAYSLTKTSCTSFQLANDLGTFSGNIDFGSHAPGSCVSITDVAGKTVDNINNNYFNPTYYVPGFVNNYDYRANSQYSSVNMYGSTGTLLAKPNVVRGVTALSGGAIAVTLPATAFPNNDYICTANDEDNAKAIKVVRVSSTSVQFWAPAGDASNDHIAWNCSGR